VLWLTGRLLARSVPLVAASLAITACAAAVGTNARSEQKSDPSQQQATVAAPNPNSVAVARRLTAAQLAGQRIVYAYSGLTPPRSLLALIRAGEAAGVILFGPNISSRTQLRHAIEAIQQAATRSPVHVPLLVMTDQEGGPVRRLPGAPQFSERQIGASVNPERAAGEAGRGAGSNLGRIGINVNLAPVLDVYRHAGDFIDEFERSYGTSVSVVSRLGAAFIRELQAMGVAATAKHFPGLGVASRSQNTDVTPVTLDQPLDRLRAIDEPPYEAAINAGVRLVMVSWATYPALDPAFPAGLSAAVIQGELRGRLGFRGVTITDGLAAGALARFGTAPDRGLEAASAGDDLILCSATSPAANTPSEGVSVARALRRAMSARELTRASMEQAVSRVLALRAQARP
jgi:beta-N-acetylhexosaminidase